MAPSGLGNAGTGKLAAGSMPTPKVGVPACDARPTPLSPSHAVSHERQKGGSTAHDFAINADSPLVMWAMVGRLHTGA